MMGVEPSHSTTTVDRSVIPNYSLLYSSLPYSPHSKGIDLVACTIILLRRTLLSSIDEDRLMSIIEANLSIKCDEKILFN